MDSLDWIKDEELPILPYVGKRFKLITDDGQDSGRRYQILEYYFEDVYNKDFYVKSILLNPRTLKPETKKFGLTQGQIFHTPVRRAMELINNGNWVFLDTINESQDDFDWAKGDVYFTIDDIIGKQIYYRKNNLSDLEYKGISFTDLNRGDVELGDIRWSDEKSWIVTEILPNGKVMVDVAYGGLTDYNVEDVEIYVNLGIWVLVDQNGNILNDFKNKNIEESEYYLDGLVSRLSLLTEDGKTEPDMEWDFTKGELDKSKKWVKTKEDVKKYLTLLFDKMKRIPKKVKINILKYVLASFVGILTVSELTKVVDEVSDGKIILNKPKEKIIEPEVVKIERIRKPSDSLIEFLKDEEGYSDTGYNIGDGKITIGWGHAEDINNSQYKVGQKISKQEAEKLLRQDVKVASDALNRILDKWESDGIKVDINQDMYDAMTSMSYNMGIGNFRNSDFIQMVKRGEMEKAKEEIKSVSSQMFNKYPGLKKRRKKESEMFNLV